MQHHGRSPRIIRGLAVLGGSALLLVSAVGSAAAHPMVVDDHDDVSLSDSLAALICSYTVCDDIDGLTARIQAMLDGWSGVDELEAADDEASEQDEDDDDQDEVEAVETPKPPKVGSHTDGSHEQSDDDEDEADHDDADESDHEDREDSDEHDHDGGDDHDDHDGGDDSDHGDD